MLLLCCFCYRYDDQFVVVAFDSAPTADSEIYGKLDHSVRDAHGSQVSYLFIMHDNDPFVMYFVIIITQ